MWRCHCLGWAALIIIFSSSRIPDAAGQPEVSQPNRFEVYTLGAADAESTLEAVRAFVGDEGQVTPDPVHQRLLVVTTPERHARIADLMKKLAVPPRNVRIDVFFDSTGRDRVSEASLGGSGEITHGPGGFGANIKLKPKLVDQTTTFSGRHQQTLLVSSGRDASLRVGENVPYLQWIMDFGWRGGFVAPQLAWQEVGAFLVVQPTVIGDGPMIRVRLTPELRGLVDGRPEHVRFSAVQTEVMATDGQPLDIGGLGSNSEFYNRFLVGVSKGGKTESLNIRLVPTIQTPVAPPRP
ncbi:MAG TPA: hypothetical protein PKE12_13800 [Kiritimatiellia bacterium]|nr:hypothetical protein [Kiritimatiellia bacterium]